VWKRPREEPCSNGEPAGNRCHAPSIGAKKLASVRASGAPRRRLANCRQRPRRPGWVLKAIVQVLADRGKPMHVYDIHAAVEALVGESVPPSSVKGGLAKNVAGSSARFVRVARGRYILA
jgi:hypothetical protein